MPSFDELRQILSRIDGRGYNAYHEILGAFTQRGFTLFVDHVQGDPFAAPSKLRLRIDQDCAQLPEELYDNPVRCLAFEDFLTRRVQHAIHHDRSHRGERRGSGKSGLMVVDVGGQEVLKRTATVLTPE